MFNLSKHSQEAPAGTGALGEMHQTGGLGGIGDQLAERAESALNVETGLDGTADFDPAAFNDIQQQQDAELILDFETMRMAHDFLFRQGQAGHEVWYELIDTLAAENVANQSDYRRVAGQIDSNPQLAAMDDDARAFVDQTVINGPLGSRIKSLMARKRGNPPATQAIPTTGFNMSKFKTSQVQLNDLSTDSNPFVEQYIQPLMLFTGRKDQNDARSEAAKQEILGMVSPAAIEEVNSPLEKVQAMNPVQANEARQILAYVYDNWVAPGMQTPEQTMEPVMSQKNPKGIIKHDLSAHILNNRGLVKTAADQFGQQYLLYGPTEKRICPKLRGKGGGQPGSGDVVSEYICRHHCLDGIVIDDNKTICGEALWRAHIMDKYSREYVDAEGKIVGGYLNKRFETNRNVPEENQIRLKPGETRKPRPPEWGSTESRMQAMRKAEGKKRDYRPDTNTGSPFQWCKDVDQNNVQVSQSERDRRETAMGHQSVQYTNKTDQENKPKLASTGAWSAPAALEAAHTFFRKGWSEDQVRKELSNHVVQDVINAATNQAKKRMEREALMQPGPNSKTAKGFNLKNHKVAQMTGPRGPFGPDNPRSDDLGLSPDYIAGDDPTMEEHLHREREPSPYIEDLVGQALLQFEKMGPRGAADFIRTAQVDPQYQNEAFMEVHDWDDVVNDVYDELQRNSPQAAEQFMNFMYPSDPNVVASKKDKHRGKSYSAYINDKNEEENWQEKNAQGGSISPTPADASRPPEEHPGNKENFDNVKPTDNAKPKRRWYNRAKDRAISNYRKTRETLNRGVNRVLDYGPDKTSTKVENDRVKKTAAKESPKKKGFNLKHHKTGQFLNIAKSPPHHSDKDMTTAETKKKS